jgi:glyoxylase-like metal-dependent hydrolase (beta-lactamase superfamily II)
MNRLQCALCCLAVLVAASSSTEVAADSESLTEHCLVKRGPINGVVIRSGDQQLAVYGWDDGPVDQLLLTHGRRDVIWRAEAAAETATIIAPVGEKYSLENGTDFWARFAESRYHDYAQQSTKIANQVFPVSRWVDGGDTVSWNGLTFEVLKTPGFTRGAVTYVVELDGKRIGFSGDLIYGDGKVLDLYSFQDAIPGAQVRGYHGYGARLADLVSSLDKIVAANLDVIVPARGPLIRQPTASALQLKERAQAVYRNYLSTSALHWYFKADRMRSCGERVLGEGADIRLMPYAQHEKTPEWIFEEATSRLLISDSGRGFLLDCGNRRVIDAINKLIDQDVIEKVDGIFVTHYHDDHTDMVQAAAEEFDCPVYAVTEYADVLERPEAYHLPAMTANPIGPIRRVESGQSMKWNEFDLTFHFFPGQTHYHGALFVQKPKQRPVFFIGDAFAPSGIDDYCLLNRNLLHDDQGYLLCLNKIRDAGECWLINEHIRHVFRFTDEELDYIERQYRARNAILRDMFPWDDPNYGVDEQWAAFHPRGASARPGERLELELRITNHSPVAREFRVTPHLPTGLTLVSSGDAVKLGPRSDGAVKLELRVDAEGGASRVVTADVVSDGMEFYRWVDALVTVEP